MIEDMVALRLAALLGVGVCQLPTFVVERDLRSGRLIDLLPDWTPRAGSFTRRFRPGGDCCHPCARCWIF
jgi:DNA-binding transcriptional LysR family regulator